MASPKPNTTKSPKVKAKTTNLFKELEIRLDDVRDDIADKLGEFRKLTATAQKMAQKAGVKFHAKSLGLNGEVAEELGMGRASKYWGVSRAVEDVLLSAPNVVTHFELDELRPKLPREFREISNKTLTNTLMYLRRKNERMSANPHFVSLKNLPQQYSIGYGDFLEHFVFYNYDRLKVRHGNL